MDFTAECFEYCGKCSKPRALHVYDYCLYSPFKFEPNPRLHSILEANTMEDIAEAEERIFMAFIEQATNQ